jgi:dTDP-4-dehydrorhamnose reductase
MRLLVTGASGQLGGYLLRELSARGVRATAWSGSRSGSLFGMPLRPVDLADPDGLAAAFREARPTAVIHAGGISSVADCYRDPPRAQRVNCQGSAVLAELAAREGVRLILVSTDLVFDGVKGWYRESDGPAPLSVYGQTKVAAEQAVLAAPRSVVARLSLLFGPSVVGRPAFFDQQATALRQRQSLTLFEDEWRTPLSLATAARALIALAASDCTGLLHLGGPERLSRLEMGQRLARFLDADPAVIVATRRDQACAPELRPGDTSLDSGRWRELFPGQPWPAWLEALSEMARGE